MRDPNMPAPSPVIFSELLESLPSTFRQTLKETPAFICLSRERQDLGAAVRAVDEIGRLAGTTDTLLTRHASQREARAFERSAKVATAITMSTLGTADHLGLALLAIISAGEAGPSEQIEFPWRHLRLLLAATTEL